MTSCKFCLISFDTKEWLIIYYLVSVRYELEDMDIYIYLYSVSYVTVCIVLLWSSNDWLVVHVFGVLLGKPWEKVNHQQSDLCECAHVLVQDLVLTLEEFKHFYRDTERIMQARDLKLVCLGSAKKTRLSITSSTNSLFSPLSQHLGHVVLLHVKDDLNKQASVVSTTTCRIIFLHNPKNHGISKLVVWRS